MIGQSSCIMGGVGRGLPAMALFITIDTPRIRIALAILPEMVEV